VKRISAGTLSNSLREHLRAAGYFQKELADELGLHSKVLSRKLRSNGNAHLTEQEVKNIIITLAKWQAITTQDEALHLLEQAQLQPAIFSDQEWQTPPLSQLMGNGLLQKTHTAHILTGPLQHNLPAPLTRLIGRQEEVQQLCQLLGQDDIRLVTLVGPGGCGKTRLALHVARQLINTFTHGVWFVDLTAERDSTLVPQNIIQVLNITATLAPSALQSLILHLQNKQMLLVLDNFEQVEAAAAVVGELLAAAPGLKVLVTSRVVLRLYGETEFNVSPLDVPDSTAVLNTAQLQQYSAVQLFIERARAVLSSFTLTHKNAFNIAQICMKVDGLPLALELAAARVKVLPLSQLLERLSAAPFSVLAGGARNLPGRHQTLHDTITCSYNLLSPTEQAWFARLAVFSGGWSLEAADTMMQAIASVQYQDHGGTSSTGPAVDLLQRLVDNSLLVRLLVTADQMRFTLLETLREYALELLNVRGECERLRDWHACYYLAMAEAAEIGLRGSQQLVWRSRLVAERDNFRAALKWSLQRARAGACMIISDPDHLQYASTSETTGIDHTSITEAVPPEKIPSTTLHAVAVSQRLAAALRPYWEWQGHLFEGRRWLDNVLALPLPQNAGKAVLAARAKALSEAARLVCLQNEQDESVALAEESIALWQQLDDPQGLASALLYRGWPAIAQGDNKLAKSVYEQGLQLLSPTDNIWLRAQLLFYMGAAEGFTFNFVQMRSYYAQSRALFEQVGDKSALADVIKDQGGMAILEGNYSEAISNLLLSIELSHAMGYKQYVATAMGSLGFAVGLRGEPDPQTASLQAAQIWGAKDGLMGAIGSSSWLQSYSFVKEIIRQIETRVDEASWRAARLAGQKLTEEQAIAFCMKLQP
jgi:predicted ATPase